MAGLDRQYVRAVEKARSAFNGQTELSLLDKCSAKALTWLDSGFPSVLREIPRVRRYSSSGARWGHRLISPSRWSERAASLPTGARRPSTREALACSGVAITSGLARGVDAIALEKGAPTVAVLAGGIDQVYLRENAGLADRILEHGCLVSEYPVAFRPDPTTFRTEIGPSPDSRKPRSSSRPGTGAARCIPRTGPSNRTVTYLRCRQHFLAPERGTNQLIQENTGKLVATPTQLAGGTKPGEFGEPARFEVGPRGHLFVDCGPSGRSQRNSG